MISLGLAAVLIDALADGAGQPPPLGGRADAWLTMAVLTRIRQSTRSCFSSPSKIF